MQNFISLDDIKDALTCSCRSSNKSIQTSFDIKAITFYSFCSVWICRALLMHVGGAAGRPYTHARAAHSELRCAPIRIRQVMEDMKVSLESLYTNKVKEIDYEGEEHYQE